jgi:hypothetical protein
VFFPAGFVSLYGARFAQLFFAVVALQVQATPPAFGSLCSRDSICFRQSVSVQWRLQPISSPVAAALFDLCHHRCELGLLGFGFVLLGLILSPSQNLDCLDCCRVKPVYFLSHRIKRLEVS